MLALEPVLAAAEVTGDDRVVHRAGEALAIGLGDMGEGAVDEEVAFFVQKLRRHRREASAVEEVHEERLENVVAVMPENDRRAPFLARDPVEVTSAEP